MFLAKNSVAEVSKTQKGEKEVVYHKKNISKVTLQFVSLAKSLCFMWTACKEVCVLRKHSALSSIWLFVSYTFDHSSKPRKRGQIYVFVARNLRYLNPECLAFKGKLKKKESGVIFFTTGWTCLPRYYNIYPSNHFIEQKSVVLRRQNLLPVTQYKTLIVVWGFQRCQTPLPIFHAVSLSNRNPECLKMKCSCNNHKITEVNWCEIKSKIQYWKIALKSILSPSTSYYSSLFGRLVFWTCNYVKVKGRKECK